MERAADHSLAKRILGSDAQVCFRDGLRQSVDSFSDARGTGISSSPVAKTDSPNMVVSLVVNHPWQHDFINFMSVVKTSPAMAPENGFHIRGSLLARNTVLNFVCATVPLVIGVVSIPYVIHGLGVDRFGILSLAWVMAGYFNFLNLGLGPATTKFVAELLGKEESHRLPLVVWTSVSLSTALGALGAVALTAATPLLIEHTFKLSPSLTGEAHLVFLLIACSFPVVFAMGSLRGVLEAAQRFDLTECRNPAPELSDLPHPGPGRLAGVWPSCYRRFPAVVKAGRGAGVLGPRVTPFPEPAAGLCLRSQGAAASAQFRRMGQCRATYKSDYYLYRPFPHRRAHFHGRGGVLCSPLRSHLADRSASRCPGWRAISRFFRSRRQPAARGHRELLCAFC